MGSEGNSPGDWGGVRTYLANKGVQIGVQLNRYVQGVAEMAAVSARPPTGALRTIRSFLRAEKDVYFVRGLRKSWSHGWQTSPRYLDIRMRLRFSYPTGLSVFLSSSAVERSAVNRLVVGSNPTSGAKQLYRLARRDSAGPLGFEPLGSSRAQRDRLTDRSAPQG